MLRFLLHFKFGWIPLSSFRGEVINVSTNQTMGRQSCFSDRSEKHKLCLGGRDLPSCQASLNYDQRIQRNGRKWQSEARAAILIFWSAKKYKLGRGPWDLASCLVSLNSVPQFLRNSQPIRDQGGILFFWSARKTQLW